MILGPKMVLIVKEKVHIMKKTVLWTLVLLMVGGFAGVNEAYATLVTATLTADNYYGLYAGNEDGLRFIGNNELDCATAGCWASAETWEFELLENETIYVAAWSDDSVRQGFIGEFNFQTTLGTEQILTDASTWEVHLTYQDLDIYDPAPSTGEIQTELSSAVWNDIDYTVGQGVLWGNIGGIDSQADWIWGTPLTHSSYGEYQIFRIKPDAIPETIPEPSTFFLLGGGLFCAALLYKKHQKHQK
jgi:hypothetical protein